MARFVNIVFMQGEEADEVLDKLERRDAECSILFHGATEESIGEAFEYLRQWDYGDDDDIRDELGAGTHDKIEREDGYVLTWNLGLSYVGLMRELVTCDECGATLEDVGAACRDH